jgi:hypothetical protein
VHPPLVERVWRLIEIFLSLEEARDRNREKARENNRESETETEQRARQR